MSELDKLLENLAAGTVRPQALRDAVARILDAEPARAAEIRSRLLVARREELLSEQVLAGLLSTISSVADADATVLAFNDDETLIGASPDHADATEVNTGSREPSTETGLALDTEDVTQANPSVTEANTGVRHSASGQAPDEHDDATVVNTDTLGADDRTVVLGDGAGEAGSDRTVVLGEGSDRADETDDGGFDILAEDSLAAAAGAQTGPDWPTAIGDADLASNSNREFAAGDVLKQRFELISKLGEGGMGAVWKAKDRLKEEARDRNPFVAVKLLQGDFKDHPEAFIALQREASKQQRLAHPNIATVYDFDRDADTVYMTMEAMDGEPMDSFIRKLPAEGLPEDQVMLLVGDLCDGLAYAHRAGLVHSDLKPGNAFLVKDPERELGRIKLLDFGIARASSTKADAEGEKTLFDPGQLGALTPTYATIEMFDGQDPDPRDDIYALAIIAYQLYTGKHPYGKKSAPKAKELGLTPEPIATLDKRQNRGFARGLAFAREDRTESVEEFLDDITRKKSRALVYSAVAALVLLVIGALAWGPINEEILSREREEYVQRIVQGDVSALHGGLSAARSIADEAQRALVLGDDRVRERVIALISKGDEPSIREGLALIREPGFESLKDSITDDPRTAELIGAFIARGDEQSIRTGLELIEPFDVNWQRIVKDQQAVKNVIIGFYTDLMYKDIDPAQGKYGYDKAAAPLAVLEEIYPDSAEVFQVRRELANHKSTELARLSSRFDELLNAGKVIPDANGEDIGDVLAIVAGIDAKQPILNDARIPLRFADLATESMQAQDFEAAKALLIASTEYAADNPTLVRLRTQVDEQLKRRANEQLAASITKELSKTLPSFDTLADFEAVREDLAKLAVVDPHSDLLARLPEKLQPLLGEELDRLRAEKNWQRSETRLRSFAQFLRVPFVSEARRRLSDDERTAGYQRVISAQDRDAIVEAHTETLEALLANPELTARWATEVHRPLNDLIALLAVDDAKLRALRDRIGGLYLAAAIRAREQQRFDAARELVAQGVLVAPQLADLTSESRTIDRDEKDLQARRAEESRLAQIAALKKSLLDAAGANRVDEARKLLSELGRALPADDEFVQRTAPPAIGEAYLRQAAEQARQENFDAAAALIATGLSIAPALDALQTAQRDYHERRVQLAMSARSKAHAGAASPAAASGHEATSDSAIRLATTTHSALLTSPSARIDGVDNALAVLTPALRSARVDVLPRYQSLSAPFAQASAARIATLARNTPLDLAALDQPLAGFATLYPEHAPTLVDEVAGVVETRVREQAQGTPLDVSALKQPLDSHRRLFADRHRALLQDVVAGVGQRVLDSAAVKPLDADALLQRIDQFSDVFPDQAAQLKRSVGDRLEARVMQLAQAATIDFAGLQAPLRAYRKLDAQRHDTLTNELGRTIAARLSSRDVNTGAKLVALQGPLEHFRQAFESAWPEVRESLANKAAASIRDLIPKDIYAADKLRRAANKTLPGSAAIAAIRIELPLQEIIDANKLLSRGKLSAAEKKLQEAISVDANHSDIAPFEKLLRERIAGAQADYDRYVRYTAERKDRATRKKLLASATRAWSDNSAFVAVKEPRSGSCLASLAGRGHSKRSICYDLIAKGRKGPLMVVVPAGQFKKPFAIGKYEVTADHFNRFCKATKTCKAGSSRTRRLPATKVSLEQARAYAKWLSERASATEGSAVVYRLPTRDEWAHAATANGEQPEQKSFNCRVTSGGNIIKGHALLNATAGEQNGWGLVNHIGNARELAMNGAGAVASGGAFKDPLTSCGVDKVQPHAGAPDELTGFRLVREISG